MARRLLVAAALGISAFSVTGCVSAEKYESLKLERNAAIEQSQAAQLAAGRHEAEANQLRANQAQLASAAQSAEQRAKLLEQENSALTISYSDLEKKYRDAMNREPVVLGTALPDDLNRALKELALAHPGVMEYDAARGMIRFKSDVTFGSGSDVLSAEAKSAVRQLATILNSSAARNYEFFVAGHTDNRPVTNPVTIKNGHKDNWYLSTHRAVAVAQELMRNNVAPNRVGAIGYGEQRPIADNTTEAGKSRNRRVEVLLLPTTVGGSTASAGGAPGAAPAPRPQAAPRGGAGAANLNKDGALEAGGAGLLNK